jgi:hypothetical protein
MNARCSRSLPRLFSAAAATALVASAPSYAAPPSAPQVTAGAGIKQLVFDWDAVADASYYRLVYRIGSGSYHVLIDRIAASSTRATLSVAVHLHPWPMLRYAIDACNLSGCTRSAVIPAQALMSGAIGYFKASNSGAGDRFGNTVVLSDDGRTMAVSAPQEDSDATGINGNQADNSLSCSGAVYVFRRVASGWRQEAYIKASVSQRELRFGSDLHSHRRALAINAGGTLLAVGAAEQNSNGLSHAGVVYLYERRADGTWTLSTTLTAPSPVALDRFGFSVDMSLDGRTLKVDGYSPWTSDTGIPLFRSHIFVRPADMWQHSATLAGLSPGDACENTRLSRSGNALVMNCTSTVRDLPHVNTYMRNVDSWMTMSSQFLIMAPLRAGFALDDDASRLALQDTRGQQVSNVITYGYNGASWTGHGGVHSPAGPDIEGPKDFGRTLLLNRDATLLAVGDLSSLESGIGVTLVSRPGSERRGAVYFWREIPNPAAPDISTIWSHRTVVTSPNPNPGDSFARALSMCGSGHALAVGAELEDSAARGIDGDRSDNRGTDSGAVYLY